jgi:hypothetical protein
VLPEMIGAGQDVCVQAEKETHRNKKRNNFLMYDEEQITSKIRENKWFMIYFPFQ